MDRPPAPLPVAEPVLSGAEGLPGRGAVPLEGGPSVRPLSGARGGRTGGPAHDRGPLDGVVRSTLHLDRSYDAGCTGECVPAYAANHYAEAGSLERVRPVVIETYRRVR